MASPSLEDACYWVDVFKKVILEETRILALPQSLLRRA